MTNPMNADKGHTAGERPAAMFVQIWARWHWLPLITRSALGATFTWGAFMLGYIRSDAAIARARGAQ